MSIGMHGFKSDNYSTPADIKFFASELIPHIKRKHPGLWKLVHPRRYAPPHGYSNPLMNAASIACFVREAWTLPNLDKTQVDCVLTAWALVKASCPTIFVAQDFIEALAITDPPDNLKISELEWPFEAMTFVIPQKFQRDYFGKYCPFLRVCRFPNGIHYQPDVLQKIHPDNRRVGINHYEGYGFYVTASICTSEQDTIYDFSASHSIDKNVHEILNCQEFTDFTVANYRGETVSVEEQEQDRRTPIRMSAIAIHLLMAMNSMPSWLTPEVMGRKERRDKQGIVVKEELWHPRLFGFEYKRHYEKGSGDGSHHASPRLHPRRGHWRNQRHGKGLEKIKLIWIHPVLVGASSAEE